MKKFIFALAILDSIAFVVFLVVYFNNGFNSFHLTSALMCLVNAFVFFYIFELGTRVENIEEILQRKHILNDVDSRKQFIVNDRVVLKEKIYINEVKILAGEQGTIIGLKGDTYIVEFDWHKGLNVELTFADLELLSQ